MSRAETMARKGKQPSGSTAPRPESSSVRAAIDRRTGRSDVLAVFDVDGTLVQTNVVEYFFWMRLQDQPVEDWPRFLAGMLSKAPRWLYLERRAPAEVPPAVFPEDHGLRVGPMLALGRE